MKDRHEIIDILRAQKIITGNDIDIQPIDGGVSSDIWLVDDDKTKVVVKQALPKLKVKDHWRANIRRNIAEQNFIKYLQTWSHETVPSLLYGDIKHTFFAMPYFGPPWKSWKKRLMEGYFDLVLARQAADLLADIHNHSFLDQQVAKLFSNKRDFYDLRVDPYLIKTAESHPQVASLFQAEADRLMEAEFALIHGDFSPKNILINQTNIVLLDHEVACYGDPAFDLAFFMNHLMLKNVLFPKHHLIQDLPQAAWRSYFERIQIKEKTKLMQRVANLWLMLFLARVDGKSPVEYLSETQKEFVRKFSIENLLGKYRYDFEQLKMKFYKALINI